MTPAANTEELYFTPSDADRHRCYNCGQMVRDHVPGEIRARCRRSAVAALRESMGWATVASAAPEDDIPRPCVTVELCDYGNALRFSLDEIHDGLRARSTWATFNQTAPPKWLAEWIRSGGTQLVHPDALERQSAPRPGVDGLRQGNWHHPDGGRIVGWVIEREDADRMGPDCMCLPKEVAEALANLRDGYRTDVDDMTMVRAASAYSRPGQSHAEALRAAVAAAIAQQPAVFRCTGCGSPCDANGRSVNAPASHDAQEALLRYGRHESDCDTRHDSALKDRPECTCGFAAALTMRGATPKPEAAGALAGEGDALQHLLDCLSSEHGGDHYDDACDICRAIAALSAAPAPAQQDGNTPASHDAQQPTTFRCVECDDDYRIGTPCDCRMQPGVPGFNPTQQPAVVGDGAREAFERWAAKRHCCALDRWADSGKYRYDNTNAWWECWQAALTPTAPPLRFKEVITKTPLSKEELEALQQDLNEGLAGRRELAIETKEWLCDPAPHPFVVVRESGTEVRVGVGDQIAMRIRRADPLARVIERRSPAEQLKGLVEGGMRVHGLTGTAEVTEVAEGAFDVVFTSATRGKCGVGFGGQLTKGRSVADLAAVGVPRMVQWYADRGEAPTPAAAQEVIIIEAVGTVREDDEQGRRIDWLMEGGLSELAPGEVLLVAAAPVTDGTGYGEILLRAPIEPQS